MRAFASALVGAALFLAAPAQAEHGFSRFGLTADGVFAASGGTARHVASTPVDEVRGLSLLAEGKDPGAITPQCYFAETTAPRLMLVCPAPAASACAALSAHLTQRRGKPFRAGRTGIVPERVSTFETWRARQPDIISPASYTREGQPDAYHMMQPPRFPI